MALKTQTAQSRPARQTRASWRRELYRVVDVGDTFVADVNVGIQLSSLRMPLKKAFDDAARLGVQGIEIDARNDLRPDELTDTGRRQLRKMLMI